jgi:tRNA (guanine37-N1)-methyltransferase
MTQIQILTLFPELFEHFGTYGLMRRAVDEKLIELETVQLRDYAINNQGQVDDTPYGGGSGMVLRPEPALTAIRDARAKDPSAKVILFTPRGKPLTQKKSHELSEHCKNEHGGLILLCSRYEGVDQRIVEAEVDEEISIGDYILMGGEIPAMALLESVVRLIPGVLGNPESIEEESFENDLLEYPHYTKPQEYEGLSVPEVLTSGNHKKIKEWKSNRSYKDTLERRPDLIREPSLPKAELSAALIHYPVVDKQGELITSSITTLDLHDIARTARTFGLSRLYIIHPVKALRQLAEKINDHWAEGFGQRYNPNRAEALALLSIVPDIDDMLIDIETRTGKPPKLITTSAKPCNHQKSYDEFRAELPTLDDSHVILFGTGWGLANEILDRADMHLGPICGPTEYNHLSVRSAAAIIFDRLLGNR